MKTINFILSMLALCTLFSCTGPQKPTFVKLDNVRFGSIAMGDAPSVVLRGEAVFNNPNPVGLKISRMNLDVLLEGQKVGNVNQILSASVPANSDFTLPLNIDVPLKELYKDLRAGISTFLKKREVNYTIKGSITVDIAGVMIDVPVNYEDKEVLRF